MASERPLRIAMISYYLPSGSKIGVGYQVHRLAEELVRRGHHVDVFSNCPPVEGALYGHVHVRLFGPWRTFRFAAALRRVDFSGYDVLHAHGDDYWLWRRRVPVHVRTLHGSCFEEARRIRGPKEKLRMVLLGCSEVLASFVADTSVVVSPATRRWTPWVRHVIPNGVDPRFRDQRLPRSDKPSVLFVGTWSGRKRGRDLARTFVDEVRSALSDAELWMVTQDAPDLPGPGITVLGQVSDADLAERFGRAWLFCLPSSYEGFGIPYAEAMASGCPVVSTDNLGARYVTDDGRAGSLVSIDGLGTELVRVLSDEAIRISMSEAGLRRATAFELSRVADQYERLYTSRRPICDNAVDADLP